MSGNRGCKDDFRKALEIQLAIKSGHIYSRRKFCKAYNDTSSCNYHTTRRNHILLYNLQSSIWLIASAKKESYILFRDVMLFYF